jgi:hypothetical protein
MHLRAVLTYGHTSLFHVIEMFRLRVEEISHCGALICLLQPIFAEI